VAEDPGLRRYRHVLLGFVLVASLGVAAAGVVLLLKGRFFHAFLALALVVFLLLVAQGYRADERERNP
jgi:hypothetical protein